MGQPEWEGDAARISPILSARQREWLVTFPDDVVIEVVGNHDDGGLIIVCHHLDDTNQDVIDWDGKLDQPFVRLIDPAEALDHLPTTVQRPECGEEGCTHPSTVSQREHDTTGMPLLCKRHFDEATGKEHA